MKLLFAAAALCGSVAATNDWQHNDNNKWQVDNNKWNSWGTPEKYEVEYGYDTAYVKECDYSDYKTGKYLCVRDRDGKHDDLCSFKYVKDCHREDHGAKLVKRFYKKVYYTPDLEEECKAKPHYWYSDHAQNKWYRSLSETTAEPVMSAKGASGLRNSWQQPSCPTPTEPLVEYGYEDSYVRFCDEHEKWTGKYQCVKGEDDHYEGLCKYGYVKECDKHEKNAKLVRRYFKKIFFDKTFEQDCKVNPHYFGNEWQQEDWRKQEWVAPRENWQAPKQEWQAPKQEWVAPKQEWVAPKQEWQAPKQEWVAPKQEWVAPKQENWGKEDGKQEQWHGRNLGGQEQWNNGWQAERWNNWQQWAPAQQNKWFCDNQWNSWQPHCKVPNAPRYEYGYDIEYVHYCDEKDYGEKDAHYACVKGEDDKHGDLCRYSYVKKCDRSHPRAKAVKVYWKKIYFDKEFEKDCKDNKHYFTESWGKQENWGKEDWKQEQWQAPKQEQWQAPKQEQWQAPKQEWVAPKQEKW